MSRLSRVVAAAAVLALAPSAGAQSPAFLQSFIAPGDADALQGFTIGGLTSSSPITFELYGFDGAHLTTSALWSEVLAGPFDTRHVSSFSPNAAIVGGGQYVIGLTTMASMSGSAKEDILANGRFYIASGDGYVPPFGEQDEAAFSLTFDTTTAPEPASLALLATGLVGFAFVRRRRMNAS